MATPISQAGTRWRPNVLWRSDAPLPGDTAPSTGFVYVEDRDLGWPPPTVVDLRDVEEAGKQEHPLAGPHTEIVSLPVASTLSPVEQARMWRGDLTLTELYLQMLAGARTWFPALVRTVAWAEGPTLVHCAAGKDRTGVSVAMLLGLAGVRRSDILADYIATREALPPLLGRLGLAHHGALEGLEHLFDVSVPAMTAVLDRIGDDPVSYHRSQGVDSRDIARWRSRMQVVRPADDSSR